MELTLTKTPPAPEFNNSAGRLLALLQMYQSRSSHFDAIAAFYEGSSQSNELKARAYIDFMGMVGHAFDEFLADIQTSDKIPDPSRAVITDGIGRLISIAYPIQPQGAPTTLQDAEIALIRMAGSMLDAEPELEESDADAIRTSIDDLRSTLENSEISKSARVAMLELCRLSRNALDQYAIHGARGFKRAFKKMLSELMETYLEEGSEVSEKPWWKSALGHAKLFDAIAAKLSKYKPLLESASTIFLGGS